MIPDETRAITLLTRQAQRSIEDIMPCKSCEAGNQAEFFSEIYIHFSGLKNIDKPGVLTFPKLLVCLDCGSTRFTVPQPELLLLRDGRREEAARS